MEEAEVAAPPAQGAPLPPNYHHRPGERASPTTSEAAVEGERGRRKPTFACR